MNQLVDNELVRIELYKQLDYIRFISHNAENSEELRKNWDLKFGFYNNYDDALNFLIRISTKRRRSFFQFFNS